MSSLSYAADADERHLLAIIRGGGSGPNGAGEGDSGNGPNGGAAPR